MTKLFDNFLTKQDANLDTGKNYYHNFQWMDFEETNCIFYVWHKKEIKLIESKNLWSTMNVFYIKDNYLKSEWLNENIKNWIFMACQIFSGFDEDSWKSYNFLPYFPTKSVEEKNKLFEKLWLKISLSNSFKWVLIEFNEWIERVNIDELDIQWKIWFLFGLVFLYGKIESKGDNLLALKIQLPLFGQFLSLSDTLISIQKDLHNNWIFIQISENIQWDKHIYEITSNDYELLNIFRKIYIPVENFTQITKREQTQEAVDSLKIFLNKEWRNNLINRINTSCVKILQKI